MVPRDPVGIYGSYCSWNCAKRDLLNLRSRSWFALLAITAIRMGAKLPIKVFPTHVKPSKKYMQTVQYIPADLQKVSVVSFIRIPFYKPITQDDDTEPEAYEQIMTVTGDQMYTSNPH